MTATTIPHSAPTTRGDELHALAAQLYGLISSGHDALAYNVDARGPALTAIGADGKRRPVLVGGGGAMPVPAWQRARELREGGAVVDRRFNAFVLERHVRGKYSVAPAAPGWVQWVALDIDAHQRAGESELVARLRALRVLSQVWRALQCSAERHPIVLRSPGGGYHVWFPLTRGPFSSNAEHTWPAAVARAWFERHLIAAGLDLAPGVLEVFPSGRCLRAPCGVGMVLLQATRPDDPDALGLVPWPDTMASERVDWSGKRSALSAPVRRVVPTVRAFVTHWETQRRTLAEWLGRPEAAWDPAWGFLGWRSDEDEDKGGISPGEKNPGADPAPEDSRSQQSDDVPGRPWAGGGTGFAAGERSGQGAQRRRSGSPIEEEKIPPSAPEVDFPPVPAGAPLVRGRAFKEKVRPLLCEGITQPSTRHDAVLTLVFYWGATCGLACEQVLSRLEAWCRAHPHSGSRLSPRAFLATCLREGRHYFEHHAPGWPFRGAGDGGGLGALTTADQPVLAAIDPRVRDEGAAILAWLAGRADGDGRLGEPAQIATGLLARLCGDRRVDDDGKRRRATALALVELERIGVLTLASNYRVGQRGRRWSCWYRFGSGELPRTVELPAAAWAALEQPIVVALAPTLAIVPSPEPDPDVTRASIVTVQVVGERVVPEGLLRVLGDGARGRPRTLLTLAPDVERPTAAPTARAPWFVRAFQSRTLTPGELWAPHAAMGIAFPDVEARRRMTRRERLAWGGAERGGGEAGGSAALAAVIPLRAAGEVPSVPSGPSSDPRPAATAAPGRVDRIATPGPGPGRSVEELRAELATEVGEAIAAALPIDLLEVACHAWGGFRRVRGP